MDIEILDLEYIHEIHQQTIKENGGCNGVFNNTDSKISSILAQQYGYFDYDPYPTIFLKAALLMYLFVKNHCFPDGNKRVALLAVYIFLNMNGYQLICSDEEMENKILEIAKSECKQDVFHHYVECIAYFLEHNSICLENDEQ